MLRGKAIELLKKAVENDLDGKGVPKYKEFLATMLSMITINVSFILAPFCHFLKLELMFKGYVGRY